MTQVSVTGAPVASPAPVRVRASRAPAPGLAIEELHRRVIDHISEPTRFTKGVSRSYQPSAKRLAALLAEHVEAGDLELVNGEYRMTAAGKLRFNCLLEDHPSDAPPAWPPQAPKSVRDRLAA